MDSNLQKQDIKKTFTFDTQKKTDLYDSVFGKSLYTVDKQEEIQKKDYKEQINELKEREKLMGRNSVSEAREEQKKTGRGMVLERVNEFKEADRKKMTDMEGTESSTKFFENLEEEEQEFKNKLSAFDAKELLKKAKYLVKGKKAKRTKHSPGMQAVLDRFDELQQVLSWKVAETDDLYDAQVNSITSILRRASLACSEYIGTHNSSRAEGIVRKELVSLMYDQVSKESVMFEKRARDFKKNRHKAGKTSWLDVFATIRRERIIAGNGVKITRGGAGTSDLFIVEKNAVKSFLKKEEKVSAFTGADVFQAYNEDLTAKKKLYSERTSESLKDVPKEVLDEKLKVISLEKDTLFKPFVSALKKCAPTNSTSMLANPMSYENAYELLQHLRTMTRSEKIFMDNMLKGPYSGTNFGKLLKKADDDIAESKKTGNAALENEARLIVKTAYKMAENLFKAMNSSDIATKAVQIEPGDSLSKRNVATTRLAEFLGIGNLVAKSEMKDVVIDGEEHRCIEMEDAGNKTINSYLQMESNHKVDSEVDFERNEGKTFMYSEDCLRDLCSLQVLDVLCFQTDRHAGNYTVEATMGDGKVVINKIKGIDNDMCFGSVDYKTLKKKNRMRLKSIEDGKGNMTMPAMDKNLAMKILSVTPEMLDYLMADILNKTDRDALKDRFKGVQNVKKKRLAFERDQKRKNKKFVSKFISDQDGWGKVRDRIHTLAKKQNGRRQIEATSYLSGFCVGNKIQMVKDEKGNPQPKVVFDN